MAYLVYVFDGEIDLGNVTLSTGESAFTRSFDHHPRAVADSDVVLFAFAPDGKVFAAVCSAEIRSVKPVISSLSYRPRIFKRKPPVAHQTVSSIPG